MRADSLIPSSSASLRTRAFVSKVTRHPIDALAATCPWCSEYGQAQIRGIEVFSRNTSESVLPEQAILPLAARRKGVLGYSYPILGKNFQGRNLATRVSGVLAEIP